MNETVFVQEAEKLGIRLTEGMLAQFRTYIGLLQQWNEKMNLTAITDPEEVYEKHFLDCLTPLAYCGLKGSVADIGSGAGFPGLVFAIACPQMQVSLVEPLGKRCTFLREAARELGLTNVTVINERAEDHAAQHRETYDAVTARAVAALPVLSELCVPLVKVGGIFAAMKGSQGEDEKTQAAHALEVLGIGETEVIRLRLPSAGERTLIKCVKTKQTPRKYPRNYGQIHKHPL